MSENMSGSFIEGGISAGDNNQDKIRERTQEIARKRQPKPLGEELGDWMLLHAANESRLWGDRNYDSNRLHLDDAA